MLSLFQKTRSTGSPLQTAFVDWLVTSFLILTVFIVISVLGYGLFATYLRTLEKSEAQLTLGTQSSMTGPMILYPNRTVTTSERLDYNIPKELQLPTTGPSGREIQSSQQPLLGYLEVPATKSSRTNVSLASSVKETTNR